jgi:hypothetical protein
MWIDLADRYSQEDYVSKENTAPYKLTQKEGYV